MRHPLLDDILKRISDKSADGQVPLPAPRSFRAVEQHEGYRRSGVNWQVIMGGFFGLLLAIALIDYGQGIFSAPPHERDQENKSHLVIPASLTLSPTPSATPKAGATKGINSPAFLEPTAAPTPVPGGRLLVLTPAAPDAGWVVSDDESIATSYDPQNHFGDSFLYAGVWAGKVYYAAIQFDLGRIPRGTKVYAASLRLTGLRADQLGERGRGEWRLQFLSSEIDYHWRSHNYEQIQRAATWSTFEPPLTQEQLGKGQTNLFEFTPEQLALLERRIFEGNDEFGRQVSFRLEGPTEGNDKLFAWDSGYGPVSQGGTPELFLSLGPPPLESPPPYYVVITSTPTPENIMTAVANSLQMTAEAVRLGTATPLPPNWVTPVVVTVTPTPGSQATAQAMNELATAIALTTGVPPNMVTATPLPGNWVTPVVVTNTPTPENAATVAYWRAVALTTGTPTPLPANAQTATPLPAATLTPTPSITLGESVGKIAFLSDRAYHVNANTQLAPGETVYPRGRPLAYVVNPDGSELALLPERWPYDLALARDAYSADQRFWVYVKDAGPKGRPALFVLDSFYASEQQLTHFGTGIAYDPSWSPAADLVAFVSDDTRNDEIWTINADGTGGRQLTRNDSGWDKHPSWSPDGRQIVFFSNRMGNDQIWIMNADGSEQRPLMERHPYNDWDPVWIKYTDPVPAQTSNVK
jgi:hypothetical protein